ncbi:uncharacterized protein BT62DRAFT_248887 [Guyanagaster necrorhizus]|uniref:Uncharacterized protein n=1 Tax=Guyanagaster necrorhizus TaxID=856835 RepID=A0A9P7VQ60_9AGAR|nr:uncharacterized protein BT62DRAFT_248887 [Guyanagaster necrorhizus MCA 3950]KAG7444567.1 hypothetical protein BT62DRAFT_248887 [Guyanagaster necrorhizus MCA 3950]
MTSFDFLVISCLSSFLGRFTVFWTSLRTPTCMLIASDLFMISICVSLRGYLSSTLRSSQLIGLSLYRSPAYIIITIYHFYSPYTLFYLFSLYFLFFSLPLFIKPSPICIVLR